MAGPDSSHNGRKLRETNKPKPSPSFTPDCPDAGTAPRYTAPVKKNSVIDFSLPPAMGRGDGLGE
jgi:hypothetical protein